VGNQKPWGWIYGADGELTDVIRPVFCHPMLSNAESRLNREIRRNSFVLRMRSSATGNHFLSPHTLWLGELKPSTTVDLNTFGRGWTLLDLPEWLTDAVYQVLLGAHEEDLGSSGRPQSQRRKREIVSIDTDGPWD